MDWSMAIDRNREALKRVLAALIAMVNRAEGSDFYPRHDALAQNTEGAEGSQPSRAHILPRRLYRAVLRLLRPAEIRRAATGHRGRARDRRDAAANSKAGPETRVAAGPRKEIRFRDEWRRNRDHPA